MWVESLPPDRYSSCQTHNPNEAQAMKSLLAQLVAGGSLDADQAVHAFEQIMTGRATPAQVGAMLALIAQRGATTQELLGAARVMRDKVAAVAVPAGLTVVDTCGTGGDAAGTFNISTASALVVAGAGRPHNVAVAKHGNRSVTSRSGSSQVLEAMGVKLRVQTATLARCLDEAGICFCFAPAHHPAMKHVAPLRQELGFRTLFNLLGPLTNPAHAKRQVIGVFDPGLTQRIAQVLQSLGSVQAMVVHGQPPGATGRGGGLDELTTAGMNRISHLRGGDIQTYDLDPGAFGFAQADLSALSVDGPQASAEVIQRVLSGQPGPTRDIVCLNAAAALVVADVAADLGQGIRLAAQAIDSGQAAWALKKLVELSQAAPTPTP